VRDKTKEGFTVIFGDKAPDGATFDWHSFRSAS
jgi:hypothetical protein